MILNDFAVRREFAGREVEALARELRERVLRWGWHCDLRGLAPTKTLAKVANFIVKKRRPYRDVCDLRFSQVRAELPDVSAKEVWGIEGAWPQGSPSWNPDGS